MLKMNKITKHQHVVQESMCPLNKREVAAGGCRYLGAPTPNSRKSVEPDTRHEAFAKGT